MTSVAGIAANPPAVSVAVVDSSPAAECLYRPLLFDLDLVRWCNSVTCERHGQSFTGNMPRVYCERCHISPYCSTVCRELDARVDTADAFHVMQCGTMGSLVGMKKVLLILLESKDEDATRSIVADGMAYMMQIMSTAADRVNWNKTATFAEVARVTAPVLATAFAYIRTNGFPARDASTRDPSPQLLRDPALAPVYCMMLLAHYIWGDYDTSAQCLASLYQHGMAVAGLLVSDRATSTLAVNTAVHLGVTSTSPTTRTLSPLAMYRRDRATGNIACAYLIDVVAIGRPPADNLHHTCLLMVSVDGGYVLQTRAHASYASVVHEFLSESERDGGDSMRRSRLPHAVIESHFLTALTVLTADDVDNDVRANAYVRLFVKDAEAVEAFTPDVRESFPPCRIVCTRVVLN